MKKNPYVRLFDSGAAVEGEINFHDRLPAMPTERIFKDSGQMIAPCVIARTGVMNYRAKELGELFKDRNPEDIIRVATFEEDLFDANSLATYRSSPITNGHPDEDVTSENATELAKGQLEGMPIACQDKGELQGVLVINDADLIAEIKAGKAELSSGHKCRLVLNDTGEGDWDAKKVGIKNNHIAVEKSGRAGNARIADSGTEVELVTLKDAMKELETKLAVSEDAMLTLKDSLASVTAKLEASEAMLKDAVARAEVDKLVKDRVILVSEAMRLCDSKADFSSMDDVEIKREVLNTLLDKDYQNKDDAFINMRYEVLLEDGVPDDASNQFQKAMKESFEQSIRDAQPAPNPAEEARARMIARQAGNK